MQPIDIKYIASLKHILSKPVSIALLLTILIYLLLPEIKKIHIKEHSKTPAQFAYGSSFVSYSDLDGNGETEKITSMVNLRGEHAITVQTMEGKNIEQWNFIGKIPEFTSRFYIGDADKNGFEEIYLFSHKNDSVLLHCIEPLKEGGLTHRNILVDVVRKLSGKIDYFINPTGFIQMGNDSSHSFVFSLIAGHSIYPRRTYSFNPLTQQLRKSPNGGWQIASHYIGYKQDGKPYILNGVFAPGNIGPEDTIPYTDHSAWLVVWDENLQPIFEPIEFPGYNMVVYTEPFSLDNDNQVFFLAHSNLDCDSCTVYGRLDLETGRLLKKRSPLLENNRVYSIAPGAIGNPTPLIYDHDEGILWQLSPELELQFYCKVSPESYFMSVSNGQMDFNRDGKPEYYYIPRADGFLVASSNLKHEAKIQLGMGAIYPPSLIFSPSLTGNHFSVQNRDYLYHFEIGINPFFYWRWPVLLAIFLLFTFLFEWSRRMYASQIRQKMGIEHELTELQFKSVTNQLDPHFAFNMLNVIGSSILTESKQEAYNKLVDFSRLMRQALMDSDQSFRSLETEISLLEQCLQLQQQSQSGRFSYSLYIENQMDLQCLIPKMLLQAFAENALKHGIFPLDHAGELEISIKTQGNAMEIVIKDNGIGRKKAGMNGTNSTGKGMLLYEKLLALYNKQNKGKFNIRTEDLFHQDQSSAGTKVTIHLPLIHQTNKP